MRLGVGMCVLMGVCARTRACTREGMRTHKKRAGAQLHPKDLRLQADPHRRGGPRPGSWPRGDNDAALPAAPQIGGCRKRQGVQRHTVRLGHAAVLASRTRHEGPGRHTAPRNMHFPGRPPVRIHDTLTRPM